MPTNSGGVPSLYRENEDDGAPAAKGPGSEPMCFPMLRTMERTRKDAGVGGVVECSTSPRLVNNIDRPPAVQFPQGILSSASPATTTPGHVSQRRFPDDAFLRAFEFQPEFTTQGFKVSSAGVYAIDPPGTDKFVFICSPLYVLALTRDVHNENWGYLLHWEDPDGVKHTWAMPKSILGGGIMDMFKRLYSGGLDITPEHADRLLLPTYIRTVSPPHRIRCVDQVGWAGGQFVLPDETFGPDGADPVVFQSATLNEHAYGTAGSIEDWRTKVGSLCSGNSRLLLVGSAAFAGALLDLLHAESGGLHLIGRSSIGKTTALSVAGSCWGGGGPRGFTQTWRATSNGLEAVAALHNGTLLCLDEIAEMAPAVVGETVYMLANGQGKIRMSQFGTGRRNLWQLLFLSTGETTIATQIAASGKRAQLGQEVRVLNVPADAGCGMGLFENIHGFPSPSDFARYLSKTAKTVYGTAGREFVARLARDRTGAEKVAGDLMNRFVRQNFSAISGAVVSRAAQRFAVIAAAGEIATSFGLTGWAEGEAIEAAAFCFRSWRAEFQKSTAAPKSFIRPLREFIIGYGDTFVDLDSDAAEPLGADAPLGFTQATRDGGVEYVLPPETFRHVIYAGQDYQDAAMVLRDSGVLQCEEGRFTKTVRLPGNRRIKAYVVRASALS